MGACSQAARQNPGSSLSVPSPAWPQCVSVSQISPTLRKVSLEGTHCRSSPTTSSWQQTARETPSLHPSSLGLIPSRHPWFPPCLVPLAPPQEPQFLPPSDPNGPPHAPQVFRGYRTQDPRFPDRPFLPPVAQDHISLCGNNNIDDQGAAPGSGLLSTLHSQNWIRSRSTPGLQPHRG